MFKLVISDDEGKTTVVPLVREEITIGRKEGNTIRLTERNVSRRHARLRKSNGAFALEDLGSYNGVKVNGRRIEREATLKAGDQIAIGDYLLALQLDAAADTVADTVPSTGVSPTADAATAMIAAPVEPVAPARLVMTSPPAPGAEFALSTSRIRIGRAEDLDVWVNHRSISREHAQVLREGGAFRVVDMGSANGVRVNGQDVQQAPIRPGDVIELGQVRFRFVGEGEVYAFEADRTIQVEPVMIQAKGSKAPWIAAIVLVLVAIPVASIIALTGGDQPVPVVSQIVDPASPTDPGPLGAPVSPSPGVPENPPVAAPGPSVAEAIRACREAVAADRWAAAQAQADIVLLSPGNGMNDEARACRGQAADGLVLSNALGLLQRPGGATQAYTAVQSLPAESAMRARPDFDRVVAAYYDQQVAEARTLFAHREFSRAAELAATVIDAPDAPEAASTAANLIRSRSQAATTVAVAPTRPTHVPRGGSGPGPSAGGTEVRTPTGGGNTPAAAAASPDEEAQRCGTDNACIIRALGPRGRLSARNSALLIEAYRSSADKPRMCRAIATLLDQYPETSQARTYRQISSNQCR